MRLFLALVAGLGTAMIVAIVLTILDLYLTGHGQGSITTPLLDRPALGVHLSLADMIVLVAAVLAAGITWRGMARDGA